jgi:hypothetical protein
MTGSLRCIAVLRFSPLLTLYFTVGQRINRAQPSYFVVSAHHNHVPYFAVQFNFSFEE